jgi:tetratricopeptide (TPR) repeat protein
MSTPPAAATYPGNPSLPREVREKILSTFRHTLNLYHQGKSDDCVIGCDFILKMDPRFGPARKLMEKAKNSAADVDVAELEALVTATPTRQERVQAVDPERLLVRAVESYNARDFDAAIATAGQVLAVLPGNRDALEILDKAAGKKAAQPLFDASRQRALAALENKRPDEARQELDRMRGLDPDHPAVTLLERRLGGGSAPAPPLSTRVVPPPPANDEIRFDLTSPEPLQFGGLGGGTSEPDIQFDAGQTVSLNLGQAPQPVSASEPTLPELEESGLESLSLDSLSLDPSPPTQPVADMDSTNPGSASRQMPPSAPPGSPADLWTATPGAFDLDEPPVPGGPPPPPATPPPPTPQPPSTASLDEEEARNNDREISALMRQGDELARRGDRQQAIEVWSRIFLIDINNSEAVSRIEATRQGMAEGNRVISDGLKAGREKYEAGDHAAARELFLQVLAVDENDATARFYIDKIEEEIARGGGPSTRASMPAGSLDFGEESARPASPVAAASAPPPATKPSRGLSIPPRVLAMIAAAVVVIAVGVYLVIKSPRRAASTRSGPASTASAAGSLARARELSDAGQVAEARRELLRVPRSSPDFEEARRMLSELGQASQPAGVPGSVAVVQTTPAIGGPPPPSPGPNDPARLRATAEQALVEKRYIDALKNFNLAAPSFRNDPTFAQAMGLASDKVQTLAPAVKLYNEAEYDAAIPFLWRIYQEDRQNQDARSYLLHSYYNQGVTQLQNGLFPKAVQSFDEALAIDPKDSEIIRHRKFAEHYLKGDLDLMGRIYVRHLTPRR